MTPFEAERRRFLGSLAFAGIAGLFPGISRAFPIERILGPGNSAYISEYLRRLESWYGTRFFDFRKAMTRTEREYVEACRTRIRRWGILLNGVSSFEHAVFSHRIRGDVAGHGRLVIGPSERDAETLARARAVLAERGVSADLSRFFSLGWDFERDLLKVYSLHENAASVRHPGLSRLLPRGEETKLFWPRLSCESFVRGKLRERKLVVAYRELPAEAVRGSPFAPAVISAMRILRTGGEPDWHLRLRSFHLSFLSEAGRPAALAHQDEFAQLAISMIWRRETDYTLYYP